MDLNISDLFLSGNISSYSKNDIPRDTILQLDCFSNNTGSSVRDEVSHEELEVQDDSSMLALGLGLSSYSNNNCSAGTFEMKNLTQFSHNNCSAGTFEMKNLTQFSQELSNDADSRRLELGVSRVEEPVTSLELNSINLPNQPSPILSNRLEGGMSIENYPETNNIEHLYLMGSCLDSPVMDSLPEPKAHHHHPKKCRFRGCSKGARGASGLCIIHGGGDRCHRSGCGKGAESRSAFCKSHGGGQRCQHLGCTKSAEGRTEFCIGHGGGRRCSHLGCTKAARGKSGLCIKHGGGKRCSFQGCTRSAEGQVGLCISHGGGRRCKYPGCCKGAQGSTKHCKLHGGGKRCIILGCTKGAEGSTLLCKGHGGGKRCLHDGGGVCTKSVHGATNYCVAHGGGKRCAVACCTKSARGRTDCCVRHGGGKRCRFEGCGKSAQGSTDFCKAHGGGKRCNWALGCEKYARGKSGLCAAHGNIAVEKHGSAISSGLFCGIFSSSTVDNCYSSSMVNTSPESITKSFRANGELDSGKNDKFVLPEGRVHGGGLMFLLGGDFHAADVSNCCG